MLIISIWLACVSIGDFCIYVNTRHVAYTAALVLLRPVHNCCLSVQFQTGYHFQCRF